MQSPHTSGPPLPFLQSPAVPGFYRSYPSPTSFYNVPLKPDPDYPSPAHYVTPFDTGATQVITQPITTTQQVAAHVVASTGGYDFSQAQALYTHQVMAGAGTDHGQTHGLSPTTRACPQTIKWLIDNYETAEGVSLPRSTLYNHYLRHCAAKKIDAVNAASFGKLIRSVFIGLKTRRLGTRGNSKYHYYGIRIKPESPLNTYLQDDGPAVAMRQPSATQKDLSSSETGNGEGGLDSQGGLTPHHHLSLIHISEPTRPY